MKLLILLCTAFCLIWGSCSHAQYNYADAAFFLSLEDIPLMDGLEELPAETLSFDKPEGRIIESYAALNNKSEADVSNYYAQTLPAFGWGQVAKNKFFRNDENLELSFETQDGRKYLKITIRPSL